MWVQDQTLQGAVITPIIPGLPSQQFWGLQPDEAAGYMAWDNPTEALQ